MEDWTFVGKKARSTSSGKKQQSINHTVGKSHSQPRNKKNMNHNHHHHDEENTRTDVEYQQMVTVACESLMRTDFCSLMFESLFPHLSKCHTIIGLGLGSFVSSPSSLLQLAFTLSLLDECQRLLSPEGNIKTFSAIVFDPMFSSLERRICESLHLNVSADNKLGMHRAIGSTIFFMPHCPYRLYCNLLWENWDNLEHVFIIGNSFSSYELRRSLLSREAESSVENRTDCIRLLRDLITEIPLWELYWESHKKGKGKGYKHNGDLDLSQLEGAFCDTSLHYFKKETLISRMGQHILSSQPCREDMEEAAKHDVELFSDEYDTIFSGEQHFTESSIHGSDIIKPETKENETIQAIQIMKEEMIVGNVEFAPLFATNILPTGTLMIPSGRKIHCHTRSIKTFNDMLFVDDIWPGSRCLVDYLMKNVHVYRGKTVIELGAGAALPGLMVAADGALFTLITDYPAPGVIENIDRLISLNQLTNVSAMGHVWGAENVTSLLEKATLQIRSNDVSDNISGSSSVLAATSSSSSSSTCEEGFDVVLMAELLWKDTYMHHRALLESVVGTLKKDGVAYAAFAHRPTQVHLPSPPPPPPPATTTTATTPSTTTVSPPQHTLHTIENDMEFFTMAESLDFNLVCEPITSCRQYCDVGSNDEFIEVKIFTLRFRS